MAVTWQKIIALLVALGYVTAAALVERRIGPVLLTLLCVVGPLALIWFPEYLGGAGVKRKKTILGTYADPQGLRRPTRDSHPALVVAAGWFFLVVLPIIIYALAHRGG